MTIIENKLAAAAAGGSAYQRGAIAENLYGSESW